MTDPGGAPHPPRRPLSETITLIFAASIAFCLLAGVVGVVTVRIVEPGADVGAPASSLGTLLSVLAGYIVGAYRSRPGNGNGHGH